MSGYDSRNVKGHGVEMFKSARDPIEACIGDYGSGHILRGIKYPDGLLAGITDVQGTVSPMKWRALDWLKTAQGGAGTTLVPSDAQPAMATFVTRATADGDGYNIQWSIDDGSTAGPEIFLPTAGLTIVGLVRMKVDNAANDAHTKSRFYFGIGDKDTAIHGSVSNFAGVYKASGAANVKGILDAGAQTLTAATQAIANDTWFWLGFRINGVTSVEHYFGTGTTIGSLTRWTTETTMTNLPATEMLLAFEGQTSEAAAITYSFSHMVVIGTAI